MRTTKRQFFCNKSQVKIALITPSSEWERTNISSLLRLWQTIRTDEGPAISQDSAELRVLSHLSQAATFTTMLICKRSTDNGRQRRCGSLSDSLAYVMYGKYNIICGSMHGYVEYCDLHHPKRRILAREACRAYCLWQYKTNKIDSQSAGPVQRPRWVPKIVD